MWSWSIGTASGKERRERREEEPGGESGRTGVERGERSPLFSSKVVECVSNKEVVTVCRHIVEVSQYRTFSIFVKDSQALPSDSDLNR